MIALTPDPLDSDIGKALFITRIGVPARKLSFYLARVARCLSPWDLRVFPASVKQSSIILNSRGRATTSVALQHVIVASQ
jgi:hypothetical protein